MRLLGVCGLLILWRVDVRRDGDSRGCGPNGEILRPLEWNLRSGLSTGGLVGIAYRAFEFT